MAKEPEPTKEASTLTVKFVEVLEPMKDSFFVGEKMYVAQVCEEGDLVDIQKAPAGSPGFWIPQDWEIGPGGRCVPTAEKSIVFKDGDGYVKEGV